MKIDFSRLDALRPTAAVPEGFEPVPEVETPFDSGYEAMYRAAWDFHLETDDRLRAAAGGGARRDLAARRRGHGGEGRRLSGSAVCRGALCGRLAGAGETVRGGIKNMRNMHRNPKSLDISNVFG